MFSLQKHNFKHIENIWLYATNCSTYISNSYILATFKDLRWETSVQVSTQGKGCSLSMLHHPIGDNGGKKEKQKQCSYLVFVLHISLTNDTVTESKFSKLVKLLQYHPNSTHSKYKYESKHTKGHYKCNNTNGITCIRHQCVEMGTKKEVLTSKLRNGSWSWGGCKVATT